MMRIGVNWIRKAGEANFGSRGAGVSLEVEVDSGLVREPDKLQAKIDYLFGLAKSSVDAQLNGNSHLEPAPPTDASEGDGNGRHNGNGHSNGKGARRTNSRQATDSQVRAIHAIANRQRIDLTAELRNRFGVDRPDDLAIGEACEFIDAIKPQESVNGGRR